MGGSLLCNVRVHPTAGGRRADGLPPNRFKENIDFIVTMINSSFKISLNSPV
jgi:hypothetical protein